MNDLTPSQLRAAKQDTTLRPCDLSAQLGIPEAALVEADLGHGVTRIIPTLGRLIPAITVLGEVMALTRNASCVIEKVGTYNDFHDGNDAAMTLDAEIDMRMFPRHWVHAFAVEAGDRRSVQVFDASGDAVHKVHLRTGSNLNAWRSLITDMAHPEQHSTTGFAPAKPAEAARSNIDQVDTLRREWAAMTDTHQFNALISRLKMNRLGAYRVAGAPYAQRLSVSASDAMLQAVHDQSQQVMLFVGNTGCIQIHSGPVKSLKQMGPWLNVLDDRFNLHLRTDHIAEVWLVEKPTKRGPAISVEAFDQGGSLIYQCFGMRADRGGDPDAWRALVTDLPI
jgi:putative hemin transport protein